MRYLSVVVLLCVLFAATAMAGSPQSVNPGLKIHPSLSDKFARKNDKDTVRVIVSLAASQPPGLTRAQAIAESQGRVIGAFRSENNGSGLEILNRYMTLYGFSAELTRGHANALANRGDVEFIEEMPVHQKLYTESHPLTNVDLAHMDNYDGTGAVIAIIDDGIDAAHPAFSDKLLGGYDFADNDSDPAIDCVDQSHGTAVAGVALGNSPSVVGVAPGAKMVFLKIQGSGICGSASLDGDIVGAIDWATANQSTYGIDIISMSLGGGLYSSESSCDGSSSIYFNAVQNAIDAGITVIAASGNDGMCDSMSRPACFSNVVSVGAVYDEDMGNGGWCVSRQSCARTQRHSACGRDRAAFEDAFADNVIVYSNSANFLDVAAPATCAQSAAPGNSTTDCFGGTSSATPFTSGIAALAVEAAGKGVLSPADMQNVLVSTGDPATDPKNGRITPRVNGLSAVTEAATYGGGEPPTNTPPQAKFTVVCSYLDCDFSDSSSDDDGSVVSWSWNFGGDGSSSGQNPNHEFSGAGTFNVQLTVTDDDGASNSTSESVTVAEEPVGNNPPKASFTYSCNDLDCTFYDTSSDTGGSIASRSWNFGDGGSSSTANPSHNYGASGTYSVVLMVTDNDGASDSSSQDVTVNAPDPGGVNLVGSSTSVRNKWTATVTDTNGGTLQGTWSRSGTSNCSGSSCTLSGINKKIGSVEFTANSGESITVTKP